MDISTIVAIASAFLSALAVAVSYYTFVRSLKASSRPVLVFSRRGENLWQIQNVGNGPALDIVVGESVDRNNWINITICDPLSAGASVLLPWLNRSLELGVVYCDIHADVFTTYCSGNQNRISKGNLFPQWKATQHEWLQVLITNGAKMISERDLKRCSAWELDVKRNEVYARHGYIFSRPDLAAYFEKQDWYRGVTTDKWLVESKLNEEEKAITRFIWHYQLKHKLTTPKDQQVAKPDERNPVIRQESA